MTVSIIIPTYNEEKNIGELVKFLANNKDSSIVDIIVSDAGSQDSTAEYATQAGAKVVVSPQKGRSAQMNYGANLANGNILYFIHADCRPPESFCQDIQQAMCEGFDMGRYRTKFNSKRNILKVNSWVTRFDLFICMGGDQTLFIKTSLFKKCGGFMEEMKIMEEYDFCKRARRVGKYKILKGKAFISDRKYNTNSWLQVQLANLKIFRMYKKGATQQQMVETYSRLLKL